MAFGRLERNTGPQPMSDINMTPLIDVMLVLLVIFMITAPLMTSRLKLDLPRSDAAQSGDAAAAVVGVARRAGAALRRRREGRCHRLRARMADAARRNPQAEVQLRADRSVPYGRVAEVIGQVQKAGLNRIGFVAESAAETPTASPTPTAEPAPGPSR